MRIRKSLLSLALTAAALVAAAGVQTVNGRRVECRDGVCRLVEENEAVRPSGGDAAVRGGRPPRIAQGFMTAEAFVAFLENREAESPFAEKGLWLTVLLALAGGLALNLTPCVLPMIPVNLIVIGRSAKRGAAYGLGMATAYGALGVAAAVGGLAFGRIQGNPWFNLAVAAVFAILSLSLFGVFFIDLSRFRPVRRSFNLQPSASGLFLPFLFGALSAILAGACVAPILISVLLLTGKLHAEGHAAALALPFVLGLGMALPWPFLGAGFRILPKPGAWMTGVSRAFGILVLGFAVWYGRLAWRGFTGGSGAGPETSVTPAALHRHLAAAPASKPVLVDCWASWCKNCAAMDRVLEDGRVKRALESRTVIRVRAEDISELRKVRGFENVRGLPAFVLFE